MGRKKYLTVVKNRSKNNRSTIKASVVKNELITFILLCDMPGHRMKSYGSTSLVEINGKKLIDIQIEAIKSKFKNYELIICTGFDSENLYKYIRINHAKDNIRFIENQLFHNTNSCESLRLCLNNIRNHKVFILDGSLIFKSTIFDNIKLDHNFIIIENDTKDNLEIGVNINEYNLVEHMSFGATLTWSEILFLSETKTIDCMKHLLCNIDYKNKFIFEAINDIINMKHNIAYIKNQHYPIYKINSIKSYRDIKRF
jgi:hypothetical protein